MNTYLMMSPAGLPGSAFPDLPEGERGAAALPA
jgi:hypothetical protein